MGAAPHKMRNRVEVVIVGAGPCGLFQVFELGLLGIRAQVIDSLPRVGGQCATLYPDKPIYDVPALPVVGAQELVDRLMQQIRPFAPDIRLGDEVTELERHGGSFRLCTRKGAEFETRAVIIAGGLGAFRPRPLRLPGAEAQEGRNLHYRVLDKERFRDKEVVVLGGGDSALDWTLELVRIAKRVTLVHRREQFRAQPASVGVMKELARREPERLRYRIGRVVALVEEGGRLRGIEVPGAGGDADTEVIPGDDLLVFYGLSPNLGPIAGWGLEVEKRRIVVDPAEFRTSVPGVHAIGDINHYPGKKKLILSGFHEAALTAFAVQKRLYPDRKQHLQYTTTSPVMHRRLGVSGALDAAAG